MAAHTTNELLKQKDKSHTKEPPFQKCRFREKEVLRMGPKQKRIDRKSSRTRQKNKRGDKEKWDQTERQGGDNRNPPGEGEREREDDQFLF